MATVASLMIDLGMNVARLQQDVAKAKGTIDQGARDMVRALGTVKRAFDTVLVGGGFALIGHEMIQAAKQGEQASTRLTAVLRATGHQAGLTKAELDDMADVMQTGLGFDDESLRNAQATLLKFGNIHGDVFRDAMKLSADLAAFMGTNVPEAAQMLGKSLQSPIEGLTMMERQFGKLEPAQERHIESLVKQGRAMDAQLAVLDIWRSKIGGVASEMNTELTQATNAAKNAWNDLLEGWGRTAVVGGTVSAVLKAIAKDLRDLAPKPETQATGLERQMAMLESEIKRIEQSRPAKGKSPLIEERLTELKAERDALKRQLEDANSISGMDHPSTASVWAGVRLGGGKEKTWQEENREFLAGAEQASRGIEDEAEVRAEAGRYAADAEVAAQQKAFDRIRKMRALDLQETDDLSDHELDVLYAQYEARNRALIESHDLEEGLAVETGQTVLDAEAARQAALRMSMDAAKELGLTFTSAFEDAVVEGRKLSEVLKAIEKDIARIIIRKAVTEPAAAGLSEFFKGAFSGLFGSSGAAQSDSVSGAYEGRASGGPVFAGETYMVGEKGPEVLTMGSSGGHITPNSALGGDVHITNNYHIDSRSDAASLMAAVNAGNQRVKAEISRMIKSGGTTFSAD